MLLKGNPCWMHLTLNALLHRVSVFPDAVEVKIRLDAFSNQAPTGEAVHQTAKLRIATQVTRCGKSVRMLVPGNAGMQLRAPDTKLISNISLAYGWMEKLISGQSKSLGDLAIEEGVTGTYLIRTLYKAMLAPDIVRSIMEGSQPPYLTLSFIKQNSPLPIDWAEQRSLLGFPAVQ